MNELQIVEQLEYRIGVDIKHFGGRLPERHAIAWRAYLAGIYEWGVIGLGALERCGGEHEDCLRWCIPNEIPVCSPGERHPYSDECPEDDVLCLIKCIPRGP